MGRNKNLALPNSVESFEPEKKRKDIELSLSRIKVLEIKNISISLYGILAKLCSVAVLVLQLHALNHPGFVLNVRVEQERIRSR